MGRAGTPHRQAGAESDLATGPEAATGRVGGAYVGASRVR